MYEKARDGVGSTTGLLPGALPFAARTALSFLLAYYLSFALQVQAASSAGVCVAIIAQPSAGRAVSKASWRLLGTLFGGVAGVAIVALFPQDRTLLIAAYALWLGLCAFVAGLLRDFRAYGAVLSGYTAGVIAIAAIDVPQTAPLAAIDRVAAMLIGIAAVLVVNVLLGGSSAYTAFSAVLRELAATVTAMAVGALDGRPCADELAVLQTAIGVAALRAQASHEGSEMPDGLARRIGGQHAIFALLEMVYTSRLLSLASATSQAEGLRTYLEDAAKVMQEGGSLPPDPLVSDPIQVLLVQRTDEMLRCRAALEEGLVALQGLGKRLTKAEQSFSYDFEGAVWAAVRAIVAAGACGVFSVLAGWSGATLVLIQSSAIIALVGTMPNPSSAALTFPVVLVPVALVVGFVNFLVLPGTSGFVPFALVVGVLTGVAAMTHRQASLARYAPAALLLTSYLLGPSNQQSFDFGSYANTVLQVAVDLVFVVLAFRLIPGASPNRRRSRITVQIIGGLQRTLTRQRATAIRPLTSPTHYDRMGRLLAVLGDRSVIRMRRLRHLDLLGGLDVELRQALIGLSRLAKVQPDLAPLLKAAKRSLRSAEPTRILPAAQALLEANAVASRDLVSNMAAAALLIRHDPSGLEFFLRTRE